MAKGLTQAVILRNKYVGPMCEISYNDIQQKCSSRANGNITISNSIQNFHCMKIHLLKRNTDTHLIDNLVGIQLYVNFKCMKNHTMDI